MIARTLIRGRRHASIAASLGVGFGLAVSWSSTQGQQPGALRTNFAIASSKEAGNNTSRDGRGEGEAEQSKTLGDKEPTLREDVSKVGTVGRSGHDDPSCR